MQKILVIFIVLISQIIFTAAHASDFYRASKTLYGGQGNGLSIRPQLSADGNVVAFYSTSSNIIPGPASTADIFVHDRRSGGVERINVSSSGELGNGRINVCSSFFSLSANGRFIAFQSSATNLIENDSNGFADVFVRDRLNGTTEIVSISSNGESADGFSCSPSISGNGRFVSFRSGANNLVENDSNGLVDIFAHDRLTGITEMVSVSDTGEIAQGTDGSTISSISADGRFVAFQSRAGNLVENDPTDFQNLFVRDRIAGTTELINISRTGKPANASAADSSISADGRFVTFSSTASNLVYADANGLADVFIHDRNQGITQLISLPNGSSQTFGSPQSLGASSHPSISADGRFVVFKSEAPNLVTGDLNNGPDLFVYDRIADTIERVKDLTGQRGDLINDTLQTSISSDARVIAFDSQFSWENTDTNGARDVYLITNPLQASDDDLITVAKLINNETRKTPSEAAQLLAGTQYKQSYKVTNSLPYRIYQVQVFEDGNLVCNLYALNPGQSIQRCTTYKTVLDGQQHNQILVTAKVSGTSKILSNNTSAHYTGHVNPQATIVVNQYIDNFLADSETNAVTLNSNQAEILFIIKNTGDIELYQVKTYHDPVSPVNSGWLQQCIIGSLKPGELRFCKRNITLTESGLNQAMGRVQAKNAFINAPAFINFANPTYFVVP